LFACADDVCDLLQPTPEVSRRIAATKKRSTIVFSLHLPSPP
jgi:hypothetical protein